jgi:hypothetical protein
MLKASGNEVFILSVFYRPLSRRRKDALFGGSAVSVAAVFVAVFFGLVALVEFFAVVFFCAITFNFLLV